MQSKKYIFPLILHIALLDVVEVRSALAASRRSKGQGTLIVRGARILQTHGGSVGVVMRNAAKVGVLNYLLVYIASLQPLVNWKITKHLFIITCMLAK